MSAERSKRRLQGQNAWESRYCEWRRETVVAFSRDQQAAKVGLAFQFVWPGAKPSFERATTHFTVDTLDTHHKASIMSQQGQIDSQST
jgi:hypothetical protein